LSIGVVMPLRYLLMIIESAYKAMFMFINYFLFNGLD